MAGQGGKVNAMSDNLRAFLTEYIKTKPAAART